jgi:hypothetical protein
VTTPHDISGRILLHKVSLLLSGRGLGAQQAGRIAAKMAARELREQRYRERQQRPAAAPSQALTRSNATQHLLARLGRIFDRYLSHTENSENSEPLPHTEDISPQGELSPMRGFAGTITKVADRTSTAGIWNGTSSAAQRIPSSFYHGLPDRALDGYLSSLALNERVERERQEAWVVRKAELKARGLLQ